MSWRTDSILDAGITLVGVEGDDSWYAFPAQNNQNTPSGETRDITFDVNGCLDEFTLTIETDLDSSSDMCGVTIYENDVEIGYLESSTLLSEGATNS